MEKINTNTFEYEISKSSHNKSDNYGVFSWSLNFKWTTIILKANDPTRPFETPVIASENFLLAANKINFFKIGAFDESTKCNWN